MWFTSAYVLTFKWNHSFQARIPHTASRMPRPLKACSVLMDAPYWLLNAASEFWYFSRSAPVSRNCAERRTRDVWQCITTWANTVVRGWCQLRTHHQRGVRFATVHAPARQRSIQGYRKLMHERSSLHMSSSRVVTTTSTKARNKQIRSRSEPPPSAASIGV